MFGPRTPRKLTPARRSLAFAAGIAAMLVACSSGPPPLAPLASDAVILAFGNSLTYGTGARPEESYPAVLEKLIAREVINAGVPGEVSADGLARLPKVLDRALDQADLALLILCHGGNDILRKLDRAAAERNLREMIRLAQERGVAVILVGVPLPGLFLNTAQFYERVAGDLNLWFEDEAVPSILGDNRLKSDAVHPNAEGYRKLAEALRDLLHEAGAL